MCLFSVLYYPAKQILGRGQWACGLGVPLPACNASYKMDQYSLADVPSLSPLEIDVFYTREFGISKGENNQCFPKPSVRMTSSSFRTHYGRNMYTVLVLLSASAIIL